MRTRRKRTNIKRRKLTTAFVFLLVLVFISGIGIRIYVDRLLNSNTIYEGITIDGLSMDGLTKESAERLLREKSITGGQPKHKAYLQIQILDLWI